VIKDEGQFNIWMSRYRADEHPKRCLCCHYGVRAGNGVVVVTTKHGKLNTAPTVEVTGYYGWQNISRMAKPADIDTYLSHYIASQTVQGSSIHIQKKIMQRLEGKEDGYRPFNWYDFIWKTSPQPYISVNAQGGSDKINYYFSIGDLKQEAAIRNYGGFYRTNVQMNIDAKITEKLTVGASIWLPAGKE
jgi:hypothetical protein